MSDPVTNVEIEDVLSSIRRLVSENGASNAAPAAVNTAAAVEPVAEVASAVEEVAAPIAFDKLMLTPALRVADASDAPEGAPEAEAHDHEHEEHHQHEEPQEPEATAEAESEAVAPEDLGAYALEEVSQEQPETETNAEPEAHGEPEAEPEQAATEESQEDSQVADWAAPTFEPAEDAASEQANEPTAEPEQNTAPQAAPELGQAPSLAARIAELETAVGARDDQWEPDGSEGDEYAGGEVSSLPWEDHVDSAEAALEEIVEEVEADAIEDAEELEAFAPSDEASDAPAAADTVDAMEEVVVEAIEDVVVEEAREALRETVAAQNTDAAEEEDFFTEDASVVDEDTLREMVADIVRQELQGSLGERITRNVRKLVRREIHRALAAQELD